MSGAITLLPFKISRSTRTILVQWPFLASKSARFSLIFERFWPRFSKGLKWVSPILIWVCAV